MNFSNEAPEATARAEWENALPHNARGLILSDCIPFSRA